MSVLSVEKEIAKKKLQLNALLEITQAISRNVSEESLYKIFNFTLRAHLRVAKLALFLLEKQWRYRVGFGVDADLTKTVPDRQYIALTKPQQVHAEESDLWGEFSLVIPITYQQRTPALVFIGYPEEDHVDKEDIDFIQTLSNLIVVAVENKTLAEKQLKQEAFRKELEIAGDVQQQLFPEKLPHTDTLQVAASYLPHDLVGGDYYDYIPLTAERFFICVADVSGKGVPAALMMSNFQASLHTLLRQTTHLTKVVEALNRQVLKSTKGDKFITFFGAIYDRAAKAMTYINAGHNPPLLYQKGCEMQPLNKGTTLLGIMDPLPFVQEERITGLEDFLLFAYTDGLTETLNEENEQFGTQRLLDHLSVHRNDELKKTHQDIILLLDAFKGRQGYQDDITMFSCRVVCS